MTNQFVINRMAAVKSILKTQKIDGTNILEDIKEIIPNGYLVDFEEIDQYENGYGYQVAAGLMKPVSYTTYVTRISDDEVLYNESFDKIEECLLAGIRFVRNSLLYC